MTGSDAAYPRRLTWESEAIFLNLMRHGAGEREGGKERGEGQRN